MTAKILLVDNESRDDPVRVYVCRTNGNRTQVAHADYDEHGSAGMDLVRDMARDIAKELVRAGCNVEFEVTYDDEEDDD